MINIFAITVSGQSYNTDLPQVAAGHSQIQQIINIVIGIAAALAVLTIVIAGLRMVLSRGDPQTVARSRAAILYAVIGLIIAIIAEALVTFVLGYLKL